LVAAAVRVVLGAIWYSPSVFGGAWRVLATKYSRRLYGEMSQASIPRFVAALVEAYVLAHLILFTRSNSLLQGMEVGFWIWFGFVATIGAAEYTSEKRPLALYVLNASYHLLSLIIMGGILGVFEG
jgi:hypothetical protein